MAKLSFILSPNRFYEIASTHLNETHSGCPRRFPEIISKCSGYARSTSSLQRRNLRVKNKRVKKIGWIVVEVYLLDETLFGIFLWKCGHRRLSDGKNSEQINGYSSRDHIRWLSAISWIHLKVERSEFIWRNVYCLKCELLKSIYLILASTFQLNEIKIPPPVEFANDGKLSHLLAAGSYFCAQLVCFPLLLLPPATIMWFVWIVAVMKSRAVSILAICWRKKVNEADAINVFFFYRWPRVAVETFNRSRFVAVAFCGTANDVYIVSMHCDRGGRSRYV